MYLKLSDRIIDQIKSFSSLYEVEGNMLSADNIESLIMDLFIELDVLEEKNDELEYQNEDLKYENEHLLEKLHEATEELDERRQEDQKDFESYINAQLFD